MSPSYLGQASQREGFDAEAINSAVDELIPAKFRGRIDVVINGSYWLGAAGGALLTLPLLDPNVVDPKWGWRLAFGLGAVFALAILVVRKNVPESPRWLFIHGRARRRASASSAMSRTPWRSRRGRSWTTRTTRSRSASASRSR
ncbi:MFS transporter [Mariniluteicoccus flavus]